MACEPRHGRPFPTSTGMTGWLSKVGAFPVLGCLAFGMIGCNQSANESGVQQTAGKSSAEVVQTSSTATGETPDFSPQAEAPTAMLTVQPASQTRIRQPSPEATADNPLGMGTASNQPLSGTAEWDIQQIAAILADSVKYQSAETRPVRAIEEQHRRIVALATHAISLTHSQPEKELVFNAAIHSLMDARLNLALAGDQESLNAIYEDATTLAETHRHSTAAATAASTVVKLAQTMAQREDRNSPWVSEYVRQAKLFAANFSEEEARAIVQLIAAAEFCEQNQLVLPAIECYTFVQQQFPGSPFSTRSEAALQRLHLVGKSPALGGTTLQGDTVQLSDLAGQPVLVMFWSAQSSSFAADLPLIQELCQRSGCQLLGINMDTQSGTAQQFIDTHNLPGKHIFSQDPSQRGAAQPIARQFGIHQVPSYWLVDKTGKILSTCVTKEQLQTLVQKAP